MRYANPHSSFGTDVSLFQREMVAIGDPMLCPRPLERAVNIPKTKIKVINRNVHSRRVHHLCPSVVRSNDCKFNSETRLLYTKTTYERTHVIACSSVCIPETEADYQEPASFCKATVNSMAVCRKTDTLTRVRSIAQSNEGTRSSQVRAT